MVSEATLQRLRAQINRIGLERARELSELPPESWREIKNDLNITTNKKSSVLAQQRLLKQLVRAVDTPAEEQTETQRQVLEVIENSAWGAEIQRLREENEELQRELREQEELIRQQTEQIREQAERLRRLEELLRVRDVIETERTIENPVSEPDGQEEEELRPEDFDDIEELEPTITEEAEESRLAEIYDEITKPVVQSKVTETGREYFRLDGMYPQRVLSEAQKLARDNGATKIGVKVKMIDNTGKEFSRYKDYDPNVDLNSAIDDIETDSSRYKVRISGFSVWVV